MALSLKISIVNVDTSGQQKTMRFMNDMSIAEVCKEIQAKTGIGGPDHGLFQPASEKQPARWLKENKTLQSYGLLNMVLLLK
jgi:hypothetical protein